MQMISFHINGEPAPQGSKTAKCINGKAIMWESSSKVKLWRQLVDFQTKIAIHNNKWQTLDQALSVELTFWLPKPKSVTRFIPSVKPDLDKLIRSTCDGLKTGGLFTDDALIVEITARKFYATGSNAQGCLVGVKIV